MKGQRLSGGTGLDAEADEVDHIVVPDPPAKKPAYEASLPPQHDAPHVFRFSCPDCKRNLSLFGRMGNWFIKTLE